MIVTQGSLPLRRAFALAACAAALLVPSGCGFHMATDRVYTPAAGVNFRDGDVKVLNAAIVSKADGSGTFVAALVNDATESVQMSGIAGDGTSVANVDVKPVTVKPDRLVNLADSDGVHVSGSFKAGDFVTLQITFSNGENVSLDVPVVKDDGQWAGLDTSTPGSSPSDTSSPSASATS